MRATGALPLKQLFQKFEFKIDKKLADKIIRWKTVYELQFPEALNSPLLGVANLAFLPRDSQALFDMLEINREEFKLAIRQSSIDNNFKVASDDYNLLVIWAVHCFTNTTAISRDLKDKTIRALFFMLIIKFFSSCVRHFFPYKATRAIMEATVDNLTEKFDIKHKDTNTWKLIIEKRADQMTDQHNNIHWNTMKLFTPDDKVTYVITDLQTRIRTKIRLIAELYYEAVKNGNAIMDSTLVGEDLDGEKIIRELKNSYDSMIENICNRVLNAQQFIRNEYIKVVCALCSNVRPDMMRNVLMQFSALATAQYHKNKGDYEDKGKGIFIGYHILIANLIQRTYRACIMDKVKLLRVPILKKAMNLYRSSRIADPLVLKVKNSVDKFVDDTKVSSREATNASLKIALILYIVLLSFDQD